MEPRFMDNLIKLVMYEGLLAWNRHLEMLGKELGMRAAQRGEPGYSDCYYLINLCYLMCRQGSVSL